MKHLYLSLILILWSSALFGQNNIQFSSTDNWIAYVNVFETQANGGAYLWGSPWVVGDVQSVLNVGANTLALHPNFSLYAADPTNPYWVDQTTMEGAKDLEASTFVEPGPSFNDVDLSFEGKVIEFTLDTTMYDAYYFIKALDSLDGYADALGGTRVYPITGTGPFMASATSAELPTGLIVQYGFTIFGRNANPVDETALGSIVIGRADASLEENFSTAMNVTPNPVSEVMNVTGLDFQDFTIIELTGRVVANGTGNEVDLSTLSSGSYVISVTTKEGEVFSRSFIKK